MESSSWDNELNDFPRPKSGHLRPIIILPLLFLLLLAWRIAYIRSQNEVVAIATPTAVVQPTSTPSQSPTSVPVVTAPVATTTSAECTSTITNVNVGELQTLMFDLVNQERAARGLQTVEWDSSAELAGCLHAEAMVENEYFSHWNQEGIGPDVRYSMIGGQHAVFENLHAFSYTYDDGSGAPIEDWNEVIVNAHNGLMNSPGHRRNILDPAHTHVGIGMAYDPAIGQFRLAQEFTNQYIAVSSPLPLTANLGDTVVVEGQFVRGNVSNILLDLAVEPPPQPLSLPELARTSTYESSAESAENTQRIDAQFNETITLNHQNQPGIYHIRIFADIDGQQALVVDHSIWVQITP